MMNLSMSLSMEKAVAEAKQRRAKLLEAMRRAEENRGAVQSLCFGAPSPHRSTISRLHTPSMASLRSVMSSEWHSPDACEQLGWVKNIQDPRMAAGVLSPLEQKIEQLGGLHCTAAKKLLIREFERESESLQKLKAESSDFQFAKADTFYHRKRQRQRLDDILRRYHRVHICEALPEEGEEEEEEEEKKPVRPLVRSFREEAERHRENQIPEREQGHIQRHIYRVERARGLRDSRGQRLTLDAPVEVLPCQRPEQKRREVTAKEQMAESGGKQQRAKLLGQIKEHQERMIRGRALDQRRKAEVQAQRIPSQVMPLRTQPPRKRGPSKKTPKEFEWVTAYPIIQPSRSSLIEVTDLMEKAAFEPVKRPPKNRLFLSVPPFLRSQLEKS